MKYEFLIAIRYLSTKKWVTQFGLVGVLIVSLALMIPIVSISLINGFHESIKGKHINKDYHVQIRKRGFYNYASLKKELSLLEGIEDKILNIFAFYTDKALIKYRYSNYYGVLIRGVEKDFYQQDISFQKHFPLIAGSYKLEEKFNVVVGDQLVRYFRPLPGEYDRFIGNIKKSRPEVLDVLVGRNELSARIYRLNVSGVFKSGYLEYDQYLVFTTLETGQSIFNARRKYWGKRYPLASGLGMKLKDKDQASEVKIAIQKRYSNQFGVYTWKMMNQHLLYAFEWERTLISIILVIMILASVVVTVYIHLNIVVIRKKKEIGILKVLGVSDRSIRNIFIIKGFLIGFVGTLLGNILSLYILISLKFWLEILELLVNQVLWIVIQDHELNLEFFSGHLAHLKGVLYKVEYMDTLRLSVLSIFMSILGAYFPARQASREKIVQILRYE